MAQRSDPNKLKITTEDMWRSIVYEYIASNKRGKTNFYKLLQTKYKCDKTRALKMYDKFELEYDSLANEGKSEGIVSESKEAVICGIKSRTQYVLEIQKMLDDDVYIETVYDFKAGMPIDYKRALTPLERKALYERISKFEGMDAAAKIDHTSGGEKINQQTITLPNGAQINIS